MFEKRIAANHWVNAAQANPFSREPAVVYVNEHGEECNALTPDEADVQAEIFESEAHKLIARANSFRALAGHIREAATFARSKS